MKNKLLVVFLVISFFFLRLYKIEERVNFSTDQGLFLLQSWGIYNNKELTLIGPAASPTVNGRHFFQGPIIYYLIILLMLVSDWNVVTASSLLVFLNFLALIFLYLSAKEIFNKKAAIIASVFFIFSPFLINFSNFIWNPNLLLILTPLFLFIGVNSFKYKKWWLFIIWGFLGGICLQYHFQFGLILLLTFLFLIIKKVNFKKILFFVIGGLIGYSPLLIFDLRNNFYNIRTIFEWLIYGSDGKFVISPFYFLSFVPFLCLGLGWLITKVKYKFIGYFVLIVYVCFSSLKVIKQKGAFGMPENWNYQLQQKTIEKIMGNGCLNNFNVASTVSGDTRGYDLRFLLTKNGCAPMGVEEYPKAETLFLVAPIDRPPETEKVWEVSSFGKFEIKREENLGEKIKFYELKKN